MSTNATPKAFISHASEDKSIFVIGFAEKLREKGVNAWLDRWEIRPGDSLVEKIFEEGIKDADAFLVVVSSRSILKRWVREELDSGVVARIEKSCRLIPVVIDDCEVPQALKHIKWVKIKDVNKYPDELSEIVSAIFGTSDRPPLGRRPTHSAATVIDYLPGLTRADNLIFGVFCRRYLSTGERFVSVNEVDSELTSLDMSDLEIGESLEILESRSFVKLRRVAQQIYLVELRPSSLDNFMRVELIDYDQHLITIISEIVNKNQDSSTTLHEITQIPVPVILHILSLLESRRLLTTAGPAGFPLRKITSVSAELKRILRHQTG